jgi:hypothetical protein
MGPSESFGFADTASSLQDADFLPAAGKELEADRDSRQRRGRFNAASISQRSEAQRTSARLHRLPTMDMIHSQSQL